MTTTESQSLTVGEIIEQRSLGGYQIWTVVLCGLVLVLDGFDSQTINFIAPSIADSIQAPVKNFGPIFSAGLFGLMIAAMTTGPIADRWGRKWPVICSTLSFAVFSLLTVHVTGFRELLILRFLTGLGLGGAMPNVVALASEFVPRRILAARGHAAFRRDASRWSHLRLLSAAMIPSGAGSRCSILAARLPLVIAILLIARAS